MGPQLPPFELAPRDTAFEGVTEFQREAKKDEMELVRRAVRLGRPWRQAVTWAGIAPDSATQFHMPLTYPDALTFGGHEEG